jgi:hypothetical protein
MQEMKKNVHDVINQINQDWVTELKDAEKEGRGVDLSTMFGKFSENVKKIEQHFRDFEARYKPAQKRGLFNR